MKLGCNYRGILGPGIPDRSQEISIGKSRLKKLVEEGAALFGSGYSGKPVCFASLDVRRKRARQNQFGAVNRPTWTQHAGQLGEDR